MCADVTILPIEKPVSGEAVAVAPGVLWVRMPLPFVLNHINLWLLEDGAGWTIVDCGFATDEARGCWEKIFAGYLNGKPVTRVIVTHFHPDHIGLCDWLCQKFGVMPWITKAEYSQSHLVLNRMGGIEPELMRGLMMGHGLDSERMKWIEGREHLYPVGVPSLPRAHRRIREGEIIRIGANDWRVVVGHGHSPEHASLYCEKLGVFIAGDMLLPRISTNVSVWPAEPESDPVGEFLDSLARYATLDACTLVLPSHGLPFQGLHARVSAPGVVVGRAGRALEIQVVVGAVELDALANAAAGTEPWLDPACAAAGTIREPSRYSVDSGVAACRIRSEGPGGSAIGVHVIDSCLQVRTAGRLAPSQ